MGMKNFNLPDPGEGLVEAEIVSWKVKEGDEVKVNDIVVEIETAKSLVELPIPWAGTVARILLQEGTTVEVGTPIVVIDAPGEADDPQVAGGGAAGAAGSDTGSDAKPEVAEQVPTEAPAPTAAPGGAGGAGQETFLLPDPGEGLVEAEIVSWKVKEGDEVKVNDIVVEIETAKSLVELPIPWAGTVAKILVEEGTTVSVGTPIVVIAGEGLGSAPAPAAAAAAAAPAAEGDGGEAPKREAILVGYGAIATSTKRRARKGGEAAAAPAAAAPAGQAPAAPAPAPSAPAQAAGGVVNEKPMAKPPVRKLAKDHGIDLHQVRGTGKDGVITRADVEQAIAGGGASTPAGAPAASAPAAQAQPAALAAAAAPAAGGAAYTPPTFAETGERETRTPIKGVRKVTAQAMVSSAFTAPHVSEFVTVDATAMMDLVAALKQNREYKDVKITPMLVFCKMVMLAVKRNPGMVAKWDEAAQEIVQPNYINLGFAAATPRGLMVPNIKDADKMSFKQLAEAFAHYIDTARSGKLQPADMAHGTITVTNVGVFGVDTGTPIINPGESSIVAFGAINRRPWVVERDGVETIEPRWVTQITVSFDHRLIDGELGSKFLADLGALVSNPSNALLWA